MTKSPLKCVSCGRFISLREMASGRALFRFEPDNAFGPEKTEWLCEQCAANQDTLEWRLRYQSEENHAKAQSLCLEAASEIARLNRLLDWATPRLPKPYRARLDNYRTNPRKAEPDDFLPIVRS